MDAAPSIGTVFEFAQAIARAPRAFLIDKDNHKVSGWIPLEEAVAAGARSWSRSTTTCSPSTPTRRN